MFHSDPAEDLSAGLHADTVERKKIALCGIILGVYEKANKPDLRGTCDAGKWLRRSNGEKRVGKAFNYISNSTTSLKMVLPSI